MSVSNLSGRPEVGNKPIPDPFGLCMPEAKQRVAVCSVCASGRQIGSGCQEEHTFLQGRDLMLLFAAGPLVP